VDGSIHAGCEELFGWVALIGAFVFQALALHLGLISVVQPVLSTELVFMLVPRRFWIHQAIRPITWGAAALTCASLAVFIVMSEPRGGQPDPISHHWITAALACCAVAAVLAVLARWGSPARRAALYAAACAVMWALVATFIKATTDTLAQFGVAGMFRAGHAHADHASDHATRCRRSRGRRNRCRTGRSPPRLTGRDRRSRSRSAQLVGHGLDAGDEQLDAEPVVELRVAVGHRRGTLHQPRILGGGQHGQLHLAASLPFGALVLR
jgi:hypothetical protein